MVYINIHVLLLMCIFVNAQPDLPTFTLEAGTGAGVMNCLTDLGAATGSTRSALRDVDVTKSRTAFSFYAIARYRQRIGLYAGLTHGTVAASDQRGTGGFPNVARGSLRNLSFRSRITEAALAFDLTIFHDWWYAGDATAAIRVSLNAGAAWFFFRPKARLDGNWHSLHPLRLEGQGFTEYPGTRRYRLSQLEVPAGILVSRGFPNGMSLMLDLNYRFLFTDHLDDVSGIYIDPSLFSDYLNEHDAAIARRLQYRAPVNQAGPTPVNQARGNPKKNDAWFSIQLKLGVML